MSTVPCSVIHSRIHDEHASRGPPVTSPGPPTRGPPSRGAERTMSGALSRGRSNDFGVGVRYTPCAKSEQEKEEEEGKEEEEEEEEESISILPRQVNSPRQSRGHGGRHKPSTGGGGGAGGRFRLRAASESLEDDDIMEEEEEEEGVGEEGQRAAVAGWPSPALATLSGEDLELTHCPHLPSQDSAAGSGVGSADGREYRVDSAGYGSPVPGTSSTQTPTANGPRHLPGLDLFSQGADRTRLIGERLSSTDKISLSSPIYPNKGVEPADRSSSRQSLLEIVSSRLDKVKNRKRFSLAQGSLLKKPRLSEANVNVITSRVTRRQRRKEIEEKFGKRKSLRGDHQVRIETATSTTSDHDGCNWTFVFDPSGRLCYWWSSVVSVAFLYNFWVIIYRFAFQEIDASNMAVWFTLDYTADLLYVLDIAFHFRTGYLEDGVLQTDPAKLRIHYTNTTTFYIDCLCLLPLDFLYLSIGYCSILRGFRLVKVYRFWSFQDRTERHTNYPNIIRSTTLIHYLFALFHWNACLYYIVARNRSDGAWRFPKEQDNSVVLQYLHALHWSLITLTTIGPPPAPRTVGEYCFVIFELIFALVLFATFLGHIANIVTNVSAARKEFQGNGEGNSVDREWWREQSVAVWTGNGGGSSLWTGNGGGNSLWTGNGGGSSLWTGNGGGSSLWTGNGGVNSLWQCGQGMVGGAVCGSVDREWWGEQSVDREWWGEQSVDREWWGEQSVDREWWGEQSVDREWWGEQSVDREWWGEQSVAVWTGNGGGSSLWTGNGGGNSLWTGNGGGNSLWQCGQGMVGGAVCGSVDREWWGEQSVDREWWGEQSVDSEWWGEQSVDREWWGEQSVDREWWGEQSVAVWTGNGGGSSLWTGNGGGSSLWTGNGGGSSLWTVNGGGNSLWTGNGGGSSLWTGNGGGNSLWQCGQGMVGGAVCGSVDRKWWGEQSVDREWWGEQSVDREWWGEQSVAVWTGNGGGSSLWQCGQGMVGGAVCGQGMVGGTVCGQGMVGGAVCGQGMVGGAVCGQGMVGGTVCGSVDREWWGEQSVDREWCGEQSVAVWTGNGGGSSLWTVNGGGNSLWTGNGGGSSLWTGNGGGNSLWQCGQGMSQKGAFV
ncbi:hypothetical protein ACOMHN_064063 [Nucella lapillus]